jgi:hypothetical protein
VSLPFIASLDPVYIILSPIGFVPPSCYI